MILLKPLNYERDFFSWMMVVEEDTSRNCLKRKVDLMLESLCSLMSAVIGCNGVDDSCTVCRELSLCVLWTRWHQRMRGNEIKWQHITSLFLCRTFDRFYLVVKSGQVKLGGSESMEASRVGNLAHFVHKRTLFNMDNTIFSLTSGGSSYSRGAQSAGGVWAPWPLTD